MNNIGKQRKSLTDYKQVRTEQNCGHNRSLSNTRPCHIRQLINDVGGGIIMSIEIEDRMVCQTFDSFRAASLDFCDTRLQQELSINDHIEKHITYLQNILHCNSY